jgi:tetratricopeptide (TPR) repeat protein
LSQIYHELKNYNELLAIHQKLVNSDPKNIQYLATLAYNYKIVGDYKMARETCQKILEIDKSAEVKQMVDEFLQTLP